MKIRKPHSIILSKKFPDRYFDTITIQEFPKNEINKHPDWYKWEYDNNGRKIYYETDLGFWVKWEYNNSGKLIYREFSDGFWEKWEYNNSGKLIYHENSHEQIIDNRI